MTPSALSSDAPPSAPPAVAAGTRGCGGGGGCDGSAASFAVGMPCRISRASCTVVCRSCISKAISWISSCDGCSAMSAMPRSIRAARIDALTALEWRRPTRPNVGRRRATQTTLMYTPTSATAMSVKGRRRRHPHPFAAEHGQVEAACCLPAEAQMRRVGLLAHRIVGGDGDDGAVDGLVHRVADGGAKPYGSHLREAPTTPDLCTPI